MHSFAGCYDYLQHDFPTSRVLVGAVCGNDQAKNLIGNVWLRALSASLAEVMQGWDRDG